MLILASWQGIETCAPQSRMSTPPLVEYPAPCPPGNGVGRVVALSLFL